MKGRLYIDGIDAYTSFGIWITEGGYNDLLAFPDLSDPEKNDWPEEDGVEVDLEAPVLLGKELTISFVASDPAMDVDEFISFIALPGYRIVRIPDLGREWKLRLLSEPNRITYGRTEDRLVSFSLKFADDFPFREDVYPAAQGSGVAIPASPFSLDGAGFDLYGIVVQEGRDSVLKSAVVKQNLTRKVKTLDGVIYDADHVSFKEKEVTFKCCFITDTIERFWQCYTAFFNDLIQPNERFLGYDVTGKNYKCYYKSTSGWNLASLSGRVIVEFSLTLVFTAFRRSGESVYLLATEDGAYITTEDDHFIDMSLTKRTIPTVYAPTISEPSLSASTEGGDVEILKRKISEMQEGASLENMIVPVVNKTTNRNYHIPAKSIWYAGLPGARKLTELSDVDNDVDNATDKDILIRDGNTWVHADPALVLPKPIIQSLIVQGRFDTFDELQNINPGGPEDDGLYAVGLTPPYDYYAWSEVNGIWKWDNQGPLQMQDAFMKFFREVKPEGNKISINTAIYRYAIVYLSGEYTIYGLSLSNVKDGDEGYIFVFQTGFKQISLSKGIVGTIDLPLKDGTVALLIYNRVGDTIYIRSQIVLGDVQYPTPRKVQDFQVVYSDSSSCTVQWTAPYANNIYDKGTEYDMRYANNLVDADDAKVWAGLSKVSGIPLPEIPGTLQRMTIIGLVPNKEYYIYLKTVKVNYGIEYLSDASDFAYFRTIGSEDTSKAYRIELKEKNIIPQLKTYNTDTDGTLCSVENMIDEAEKNIYMEDGYPDTTNKNYTTFWSQYKYSRDTSPFSIIIDLFSAYVIDKLFVYVRAKNNFSVYGMQDVGYDWKRIGEIKIEYNAWSSLDFRSFKCRFIKLSWDLMDFGVYSKNPVMDENMEGFPEPEYNGTIERIDNLLLYGRPASTCPEGIMSPLRRSTLRKTVDEFFCTNGHAYQQGRIHSMCSGEKMRMYIAFGHFAAFDSLNQLVPYARLADMRFRVNQIPWIKSNNGTGEYLVDNLTNTYKKYGLRPYLCSTGVFDPCLYDRTVSVHCRPCDGYWYPGAWKPVPKRGVGGLDKYFDVTMNASSYKTYAKLCQALAAKYGNVESDGTGLFYPEDESTETGLNLISGIEPENEPDQNWSGWIGYTHAEEYAALVSSSSDGHVETLSDEDGCILSGTKSGGVLSISSGTASVNRGYLQPSILYWKTKRKDATIPVDAFSMHMYFSNIGNQGSSNEAIQYGITFEEAMNNNAGGELLKVCSLRDYLVPDKEIWLTEFGWGESGARDTASKYQCYSQAGRQIGNWLIPDRHRSDVKGAWIIRACVQMMAIGVDMVNYYSTECEGNYFGTGNWDSGAGFEMFHWNDCQDDTPGAKVEAIKRHECQYARGGFATTGLFGQLLGNGAYPITRAYWWVATFRNRLKGYVYTGMKYLDKDKRIVIACFKRKGEEKGAYVVYLNDNQNTGIADVEIPVPSSVSSYKHITVYVPEIPNPENVPNTLGWDKERTGLPTSRKEKYISGKWVLQNRPYYHERHMSYSNAPAIYPANPVEGDEITVLPTPEENPYFPIVGPVLAKQSPHKNTLSAQQYEQDRENWENEPDVDADGNVIWTVKSDPSYAWRQVDAVCDYIDYHPEGRHGTCGDEVVKNVVRGMIQTNVSEFPEYYFFDAIPEPDYRSEVTDLSSRTVSSSAIELWWNNSSVEDTGYQVFVSELPETGYSFLRTVNISVENKTVITGLTPNTTYYYKIRPVKGDLLGTLSDYVSVKTYNEILPPTSLRVENRTATSIKLAWDYDGGQVANFLHYSVYRTDDTGIYIQVATIEDQSIHVYEDTGLAVGRTYKYKIKVIGLNGSSEYTEELEVRTLLPEECSPVLVSAVTDKLGSKITLTFDLPLGVVSTDAKSEFTLTEDGNLRLIQSVRRDEAGHNNLILSIPQDSLSDFDSKTDIRISYNGQGGIYSDYGVTLDGFSNMKVSNVIGNFTNISAIYQINLCGTGAAQETEWNNFTAENTKEASISGLIDTYGRISSISMSRVYDNNTFKWGNITTDGYCEIEGIPNSVFKSQWALAYGNNISESIKSRISVMGLTSENHYTIKAYGGIRYGNEREITMRVGDVYTQNIQQLGNKTNMLVIEDISPVNGVINVDFINPIEVISTDYPAVGFLILEEYKPNDSPENTDVWLRDATIIEDNGDGIVKYPEVTVHLNCIGIATAYRISETQDLSSLSWINITDNLLDVLYTLSDGFGNKTLYVQVKNLYTESNIRVINIEYKNPYVPLVLKNVYINNDDIVTYDRNVMLLVEKDGVPTHYKVSEESDLSRLSWTAWPDPKASTVPYILSDNSGLKTVYMQLRDNITESAVKVDTIQYKILEKASGVITIPLPDDVTDVDQINISIAPLKYNKRFAFNYSVDDSSMQTYSVVQALYAGKWIDDAEFCHLGAERSTGYTPEHPLYYTDGFGTKRYFAISNYLITLRTGEQYSKYPLESNNGPNNPYLMFDELKIIQDFDGEWMIHNVDETVWNKTDPVSIAKGMVEVNDYMESHGVGRSIISSSPDGNTNYPAAGLICDDIKAILNKPNGGEYMDVINIVPGEKMYLPRYFMADVSMDNLKNRFALITGGSVLGISANWGTYGGHRPRGAVGINDGDWLVVKELLEYIYTAFGAGGSDDVWFANDSEVYQYLYLKKYTVITKRIEGSNLIVTVEMPKFDNFKWFETTLLLDIEASVASCNDGIYGFTCGMKNGSFMINVNMMDSIVERAERYTAKFESSENKEDMDDALYFIQRLKSSLRAPYMARINALNAPPILISFSIDTVETVNLTVACNYMATGNITHYMLSENADFTGTEWSGIIDSPISFQLSNVEGPHTLYFKVKNAFGESSIMNGTVIYNPPAFALTSIIINEGAISTDNAVLSISFNVTGIDTPTMMLLSENADFSGAEWQAYQNPAEFVVSGIGMKTVYAKIKVGDSLVSEQVSASINIIEKPAKKVIIAFASAWNDPDIGYDVENGISVSLLKSSGSDIWYNDGTVAGKISGANVQTGTGILETHPVYPVKYANRYYCWRYKLSENKLTTITVMLDNGAYDILLYYNGRNADYTEKHRLASWYDINGIKKNPPTSLYKNIENYVEFRNQEITNGQFILTLTGDLDNLTVPVNLIEIIPKQ